MTFPTSGYATYDLVAQGGATGVDADDALPAFTAFNTWAVGQSTGVKAAGIELTIPGDGKIYSPVSAADQNLNLWARKIPLLRVRGTGTTRPIIRAGVFGPFYQKPNSSASMVLIASARAGATTLRVLDTAGDNVKFTNRTITQSDGVIYQGGTMLRVGGLDTIGFGDPANQYSEWVRYTNYDPVTGIITLDRPLQFSYSQYWPTYEAGDAFNQSTCGPATVTILDRYWDADVTLQAFIIDTEGGNLFYATARLLTVNSCKVQSADDTVGGLVPQVAETIIWDNFDQTNHSVDGDKSVTNFIIRNGSIVGGPLRGQHFFFSQSIENLTVDASTYATMNGTPKNTTIQNNSTIGTVALGPSAYGVGGIFTASNSIFTTSITPFGASNQNVLAAGWTCTNGVIRVPHSSPVGWAVPGAICMFEGSGTTATSFIVFAVWKSPAITGDTFILTSLSSGFPSGIPLSAGDFTIKVLGATEVRITNCTGCEDIRNLSQAGAYGRRMGEYFKNQFAAADTTGSYVGAYCFGRLTEVNINVITPYAGAGALTLAVYNRFNIGMLDPVTNLNSGTVRSATINCKQSGIRTIRPGVASVLQSGDTFPDAGALWLPGRVTPYFSADISGSGSTMLVEVEVKTDQKDYSGPIKTVCRFA